MHHSIEKRASVFAGFLRTKKADRQRGVSLIPRRFVLDKYLSSGRENMQGISEAIRSDNLKKGNKGGSLEDCTNDLSRTSRVCIELTFYIRSVLQIKFDFSMRTKTTSTEIPLQ